MPSIGTATRTPNIGTCPISNRQGDKCGKPAIRELPFEICGEHARRVYEHVEARLGGLRDDPQFRVQMRLEGIEAQQVRERRKLAARDEVVYYLQLGEHIKIGYTSRLKERLWSYPVTRVLLCTEPGDRDLEARRLQEFAIYRVAGNEWFEPGPNLVSHINALRTAAGEQPDFAA